MAFRKFAYLAALASGLAFSGIAQAEVLTVTGLYPAGDDAANEVRSIAVEPFGGNDGQTLGFQIEQRLEQASVEGEPYFDVISHRANQGPEALISGSATAGVDTFRTTEYRSRCVERNDKGKCTEHKNKKVRCLKRVIDLRATVKMALLETGRNAYLNDFSRDHEQVVCDRDEEFSSSEGEIRSMISSIAGTVRRDLAPVESKRQIRVLESRKGMEKGQNKAFKAAVKMTKTDESEACRMWQELSDSGLSHVSLGFNLGLCAERSGDLNKAISIYQDAQANFDRKADVAVAIDRVEGRLRAEADWSARQAAFEAGQPVVDTAADTAADAKVDDGSGGG